MIGRDIEERITFGYTKAQTIVFLTLGALSTIYPIILAGVYSLNLAPRSGLWADIVVGVVYFFLVLAMGFSWLGDPEPKAEKRWKKLNSS